LLGDAGCGVIEAAEAEEGLRAFQASGQVTTLFSDVNMPGAFCGLELAHKIHRLSPAVQLILTSGRGVVTENEMPPGCHFLPKPYDTRQLTTLIGAA